MHKKAGVDGRGVVLAGRVHECCGGTQQLGWVDFPKENGQKNIKMTEGPGFEPAQANTRASYCPRHPSARDANDVPGFRRTIYSSTAA